MNKIIKVFFISFVIFLSFQAKALNFENPYIGIMALQASSGFKDTYGDKLLPKKFVGGNVFGGVSFNECFGLELGIGVPEKKKKDKKFEDGEITPGIALDPDDGDWVRVRHNLKSSNVYLGLLIKPKFLQHKKLRLNAVIGAALNKIELSQKLLEKHMWDDFSSLEKHVNHSTKQTKVIPFAKLSVLYDLTKHLSFLLSASWKNTSKFHLKINKGMEKSDVKLKDTYSAGFGLIYNF